MDKKLFHFTKFARLVYIIGVHTICLGQTMFSVFKFSKATPAKSMFSTPLAGLMLAALIGLSACSTTPPEGMSAVSPFDITRYVGKWYEIARLDHSFERDLSDVSATYSQQTDGSVKVINRGYSTKHADWREAIGRALFTGDTDRASLKVSFFGPFYGGYHVVALDQQNYRWAMVVGPDRDYLWILSKDKQLAPAVREQLLAQAGSQGIDVSKLIWVSQTRDDG